jgi:hypothetical protein
MDKVEQGQVSSEYFSFHCQFTIHQTVHTHLWSGASTIDQLVCEITSRLSLTLLHVMICEMCGREMIKLASFEETHLFEENWENIWSGRLV